MASGSLGNLTVDLLLETVNWISGLNKAELAAQKFGEAVGDKMEAMANRAADAMKNMAAGFVAGFAVDKIAGFVMETQKAADALDEMAQKTGTTVAFLAQVGVTASMSGASIDAVASSMGKFNKNVNEAFAKPEGQAATIFKELGIAVKDSAGNVRSSEDIYKEFALALGNMGDGSLKAATAQAILGKSGAELIPTFNALAAQSEELTAATAKYGEEMAKLAPIAGALEEQQAIMATNSKTMAAIIGEQLIPYFTTLIQQWNDATASGAGLSVVLPHLVNAFKGIVMALDFVITTLGQLITMAVASVSVLIKLKNLDVGGAFDEMGAMFKDLDESSKKMFTRFDVLANPINDVAVGVHKIEQETNALSNAVGKVGDASKKAAKDWAAMSKAMWEGIDETIKREAKLDMDLHKAALQREKDMAKRLVELAKAMDEEAKIMKEAAELGAKFEKEQTEKNLKEIKGQYGEFYKAIEDAGEKAFEKLFDDTKGGWGEMLTSMTKSFKKILVDQIYNMLVKPFVVKLAAQMSGAMGGAGGAGGGAGGFNVSGLYDQAAGWYNQNWGAASYTEGGANFMGPYAENMTPMPSTFGGLESLSWTSNAGGMYGGAMAMGAGAVGGAFGGWASGAYGAGERGQAAATNYAAMGATIGMQVYGPIGAVVGAVIGTIAGIATDPDPDAMRKAVFGQIDEHTEGVTKWTGKSQFGKFGFSQGEWLSDEQMGPAMEKVIAGISTMDNALAGFMSDEQIANVTKKLDEAAKKYELGMEHLDVQGIGAIIKDRLAIITSEFNAGLHAFVEGFEGETSDLVTIVTSFMQAMTSAEGFDPEAIIEGLKPVGMMEGYQKMRGGLEEYIGTMDTSAESMAGLVGQMESFQVATVQMVMAIDAVTASIHAMFASTLETIKLATMSPEQKYNYYMQQNEGLQRQLETETDPQKIQAIADTINKNTMAAWNLLTPEQQAAQQEEFTRRITALDEYVTTKMGALRDVVIDDAKTVMKTIADRLEVLFAKADETAAVNQAAADTNLTAANTPVTVVLVDNGGNIVASGG